MPSPAERRHEPPLQRLPHFVLQKFGFARQTFHFKTDLNCGAHYAISTTLRFNQIAIAAGRFTGAANNTWSAYLTPPEGRKKSNIIRAFLILRRQSIIASNACVFFCEWGEGMFTPISNSGATGTFHESGQNLTEWNRLLYGMNAKMGERSAAFAAQGSHADFTFIEQVFSDFGLDWWRYEFVGSSLDRGEELDISDLSREKDGYVIADPSSPGHAIIFDRHVGLVQLGPDVATTLIHEGMSGWRPHKDDGPMTRLVVQSSDGNLVGRTASGSAVFALGVSNSVDKIGLDDGRFVVTREGETTNFADEVNGGVGIVNTEYSIAEPNPDAEPNSDLEQVFSDFGLDWSRYEFVGSSLDR
ncbi:MAG: hypothetical protein AAF330_00320, partial [Pseudomonadota bacterium]